MLIFSPSRHGFKRIIVVAFVTKDFKGQLKPSTWPLATLVPRICGYMLRVYSALYM